MSTIVRGRETPPQGLGAAWHTPSGLRRLRRGRSAMSGSPPHRRAVLRRPDVPMCRNCHRKLSDAQKDHPRRVGIPPSPLEKVALFLLGLGDMLHLIADRLKQFAGDLLRMLATENGEGTSS